MTNKREPNGQTSIERWSFAGIRTPHLRYLEWRSTTQPQGPLLSCVLGFDAELGQVTIVIAVVFVLDSGVVIAIVAIFAAAACCCCSCHLRRRRMTRQAVTAVVAEWWGGLWQGGGASALTWGHSCLNASLTHQLCTVLYVQYGCEKQSQVVYSSSTMTSWYQFHSTVTQNCQYLT